MNATSVIHISEANLVSCLLNNDQDSFSGTHDLYAARILGMIMKWVKEHETAEMLLCNAFERAWHERKLYLPASGAF